MGGKIKIEPGFLYRDIYEGLIFSLECEENLTFLFFPKKERKHTQCRVCNVTTLVLPNGMRWFLLRMGRWTVQGFFFCLLHNGSIIPKKEKLCKLLDFGR